ncbi:MAG: hypothetical protein PF442_11510 [Desulfobulbaceae bacterium]|jgi:hypothetical protein|nr:hypothetical protein [Desulfobulbaceae bacterium]
MKILIGITQDLDGVKDTLSSQYKGLGVSTQAGPFKTREEALNWQAFMMNRRDNYEEIKIQQGSVADAYWFGITVESSSLH